MKIVIDARMYQESGVGRYIRNLVAGLQLLDRVNEYFLLLLEKDSDISNYQSNFHKILAQFGWYGVSEQLKLLAKLNALGADVVHFPHFNMPLLYKQSFPFSNEKRKGKFVVTIHDLIHQHFQMRRATTLNPIIYKIKQFAYEKVFKHAVNSSFKILVPSNYIKDLLIKEWDIDEAKITVTYEAVDDKLITAVTSLSHLKMEQVLEKFNIKQTYIFYVGNAHPHKNVEGLIKAYLKLKEKYQTLTLVLSGYDHYFWQKIKKEYQYGGIVYTGYISDEELVALYKNAKAFVMPSFEEGFGIPLLEAMACECPVISSNAGALMEVGGDAAIYFDPHSMDDMMEKISQVLNSEKFRKELIEKGAKRCREFSWEKLAKQTLEVYESCRST